MDDSNGNCGIFGIGYEGQSIDAFICRLQAGGAHVLADVRLNPVSRKPGFSKRLLAASLAEAGIDYWHLPELGNPKWNRAGFGGPATAVEEARRLYSGMLSQEPATSKLREIADRAQDGSIAVMCVEADEKACHRYVVLRELERLRELTGAAR
jgi:uncharacterized protein (DUF488 family)